MDTNLKFQQMPIGLDAEFFLEKDGNIVGAEKYIKDDGISVVKSGYIYANEKSKFTKDGVQIEINPAPNKCRIVLGKTVMECFHYSEQWLKENGLKANFSGTIEVSKKEFDSLSNSSKKFGCSPDFNANNDCKVNIKPSGETTRIRTAGGHIHFGYEQDILLSEEGVSKLCIDCPLPCKKVNIEHSLKELIKNKKISIHSIKENNIEDDIKKIFFEEYSINKTSSYKIKIPAEILALQKPEITIPLIDLMCGIPSVLIDRDPGSVERRKLYGKAGDFRYQPHGIEYRVLSNFWIRSYPLLHLFTGLARIGLLMSISDIRNKMEYTKELFSLIDKKDIIKAINENNYTLARNIFLQIEPFLCAIGDINDDNYPINSSNINKFKTFVLNGYKFYFGDDPILYWSKQKEGNIPIVGWETFCGEINTKENVQELFKTTVLD